MKTANSIKKFSKSALAGAALGALLGMASTSANAFAVDTLLGSNTLPNSSDAGEIAALEQFAGLAPGSLTLDIKLTNQDPGFNVSPNPGGGWFIDVAPDQPGYFLLKFGIGNLNVDDHYYFQNVADFTKLVFTDAQVNFLSGGCGSRSCNIGRLSHYVTTTSSSSTGGPSSGDAPEPSSSALALLGLGLGGASFWVRRKSQPA
jgi:hypothetical protein